MSNEMIPPEHFDSFKDTLFSGNYNMLVGSGISLDSINTLNQKMQSAERLRIELCKELGVRENTPLSKVYGALTPEKKDELVRKKYICKEAGESLRPLPNYLWKRIFTLNIDNAIECIYKPPTNRKQNLISLNYNAPFEPDTKRSELLLIHLHGSVLVKESDFVFSIPEYMQTTTNNNPWMVTLAEILSTESFIIAGTSLNEVDLEYYLSRRSPKTPRKGRGPSFLIDPDPDIVIAKSECERHNLILIKATFGEFLNYLQDKLPNPPRVEELVIPSQIGIFNEPKPTQRDIIGFFQDFELINAKHIPKNDNPTPFLFGQEITWKEVDEHVDIERNVNIKTHKAISSTDNTRKKFIIIIDDAGTGKTTALKRVGHDLSLAGKVVFSAKTLSRIDVEHAVECLQNISNTTYILIDNLADHIDQVFEIFNRLKKKNNIFLIGTERLYRKDYIDLLLGDRNYEPIYSEPIIKTEAEQLIESYRSYGLIGNEDITKNRKWFVNQIIGDPISIAICRILNDFKPIEKIANSIWAESSEVQRTAYTCVALAQICYGGGLRYSILQSILGPLCSAQDLIDYHNPLRLATNTKNDEFIITQHSALSEKILSLLEEKQETRPFIYNAFISLSNALAPYINRKSVMNRTPEARLVKRLLDCDKFVEPRLKGRTEEFYIQIKDKWDWNSRYWEQRALLESKKNMDIAIQYARQAVSIEKHQFTLTTLTKILFKQMQKNHDKKDVIFKEGLQHISEAIEMEETQNRITAHSYTTLFSGAVKFIEIGGILRPGQKSKLKQFISKAYDCFPGDTQILDSARSLEVKIQSK